jgi:hypothetical protein
MSYRKITVNEIEYEYTIGKTNFKVKGIGTGLNTSIGQIKYEIDGETIDKVAVGPGDIAGYIKRATRK